MKVVLVVMNIKLWAEHLGLAESYVWCAFSAWFASLFTYFASLLGVLPFCQTAENRVNGSPRGGSLRPKTYSRAILSLL